MDARPEKACAAADVLRADFADLGHLSHMASHIDMEVKRKAAAAAARFDKSTISVAQKRTLLFQVGNYAGAVACNQKGIASDMRYCKLRGHNT